jgi:hypothetical protein
MRRVGKQCPLYVRSRGKMNGREERALAGADSKDRIGGNMKKHKRQK